MLSTCVILEQGQAVSEGLFIIDFFAACQTGMFSKNHGLSLIALSRSLESKGSSHGNNDRNGRSNGGCGGGAVTDFTCSSHGGVSRL